MHRPARSEAARQHRDEERTSHLPWTLDLPVENPDARWDERAHEPTQDEIVEVAHVPTRVVTERCELLVKVVDEITIVWQLCIVKPLRPWQL